MLRAFELAHIAHQLLVVLVLALEEVSAAADLLLTFFGVTLTQFTQLDIVVVILLFELVMLLANVFKELEVKGDFVHLLAEVVQDLSVFIDDFLVGFHLLLHGLCNLLILELASV